MCGNSITRGVCVCAHDACRILKVKGFLISYQLKGTTFSTSVHDLYLHVTSEAGLAFSSQGIVEVEYANLI